jgi:hypothetical protein
VLAVPLDVVNAPPVVPVGDTQIILPARDSTLSHDLPAGRYTASPVHDDLSPPV